MIQCPVCKGIIAVVVSAAHDHGVVLDFLSAAHADRGILEDDITGGPYEKVVGAPVHLRQLSLGDPVWEEGEGEP